MGLTDEERQALITYRIAKSESVLTEAIDVAKLGHWNLTVNRLYYAMFHACSALLVAYGLTAKTHSGVIRMIMLDFVKPGTISKEEGTLITTLFNMRNTGDYDDLFDWDESQVSPLIVPTTVLLQKIISLTTKKLD